MRSRAQSRPRRASDPSAVARAATPWHALAADAVLTLVNALPAGLSDAEAAARLEKHGPNELPRARRDGPLTLLWRQVNTPLIWVLILSGSVAMAADPTDQASRTAS